MLGFEGSTSEQKISRRIISINTGVDGIFYPPSPLKSPKRAVIAAFELVKENAGTCGVDGQSIEAFEKDLYNNLYKLWNRMASGSYFPKPVRAVAIPKKN